MKHNKSLKDQSPKNEATEQATSTAALNEGRGDFFSSSDELARRAYFSYVNQGSRAGHDVQHWLEAEAELLAERNLTRVHGFQH